MNIEIGDSVILADGTKGIVVDILGGGQFVLVGDDQQDIVFHVDDVIGINYIPDLAINNFN